MGKNLNVENGEKTTETDYNKLEVKRKREIDE